MKRIVALFLTFALSFSLVACSNAPSTEEESSNPPQVSTLPEETEPSSTPESTAAEDTEPESTVPSETSESASNILVAYFSWADNAVLADDVDAVTSPSVIAPGNVQQLAGWVQEKTGGDLFSIRVTDPYPSDWDECLARANQERGDNARPELVENVKNLENYDVVFLGYPNWWYGVPMALLSFLENNDLSGKQVYLFCSHGTGGLASSVDIITEALPGGELSDNIFDCYEEEAPGSQTEIENWLTDLGY
ncbi:MAG TPA: flavodoxin [Candidatus Eisenbergiella merdavium]|uniref:Flavodoxin n=1 Tax=Candidatus Eisenbergiella merdavium TaxID=2838551 RepID=A0A9D2NFA0_9FIRM|nr:flavodoxin [Candidatus Eisenbergiella merdavium]